MVFTKHRQTAPVVSENCGVGQRDSAESGLARINTEEIGKNTKRLLDKFQDIFKFKDYVCSLEYSALILKDAGGVRSFYRQAEAIAKKYSEEEMPEMHAILRQFQRYSPCLTGKKCRKSKYCWMKT